MGPSKRTRDRLAARIVELTPRQFGQRLSRCIERLNVYLRGWIGFFGRSCTDDIVRTVHNADAHIRRRLRALLLRQWRRRRSIARRLIQMGAKRRTAWRTIYGHRKGLWKLSHTNVVERALDRAYFAAHGLEYLEDQYREMRAIIAPRQLRLKLG